MDLLKRFVFVFLFVPIEIILLVIFGIALIAPFERLKFLHIADSYLLSIMILLLGQIVNFYITATLTWVFFQVATWVSFGGWNAKANQLIKRIYFIKK